MSRSYYTRKLIPRSAFPMNAGDTVTCKDGTVLTVGSDCDDLEGSFYFKAPIPVLKGSYDMLTNEMRKSCEADGIAYLWLYFSNGYLSMYDMSYDMAWSGYGPWLLGKVRGLTRGRYNTPSLQD